MLERAADVPNVHKIVSLGSAAVPPVTRIVEKADLNANRDRHAESGVTHVNGPAAVKVTDNYFVDAVYGPYGRLVGKWPNTGHTPPARPVQPYYFRATIPLTSAKIYFSILHTVLYFTLQNATLLSVGLTTVGSRHYK